MPGRRWNPKKDRYEIIVWPEYTINHIGHVELVQWRYMIKDLKKNHECIKEGRSLSYQGAEDACKAAEKWLKAHKEAKDATIEDAFKYTVS